MQKRTVRPAGAMALCGILGALAVVVMLLGGIIPLATFCCPVLAAVMMLPILEECGTKTALVWYVAVSLLSCLLGPDKEAALLFVFLGYYPALQAPLQRIRVRLLRVLFKIVIFNAAIGLMYGMLLYLIQPAALMAEFAEMTVVLLAVMLVMGNITFLLFDFVLYRLRVVYRIRIRPRLQHILHQ